MTSPSGSQITPAPMPRPPLRTWTTLLWALSIIRAPARTAGEFPANSAMGVLLTALADGDLDVGELPAAHELDGHGAPHPLAREEREQVVGILDGLVVHGGQYVAHDQAAATCGATVLDPDDQQTSLLGQTKALPVGEAHRLAQDAEVPALERAPLREGVRGAPGHVRRDGERRPASPAGDQDA